MDHVLTEDAMIRKLTRDSKNFPFSIDPALAEYLYQLVRETNPSLVVEIGCYIGFSTLHISKALKENNCGRLVSFDMDASRARDNIRQAGLSDWVEFIEGDSSVMLGQYLRDLKGEKIDFVFVDGDHTRRGCVRDFNALHGQIEEGGYLLFHDICPRIWEWKGPRLVLDYLEAAKSRPSFDQFDIVERTDLDDFGAAVCRLISSGKNPLAEGPWHRQFRLGINTSIVAGWLEKFVFNRAYAAIFDGRPPFLWKFVYAALKFFKGISINNRAERLWEFDFPHLKGRIIPNSIDFSWKDSPLLLNGWYDIEGSTRFKYRWTEQEFSVWVPQDTLSLDLFAKASAADDLDGDTTVDVFLGKERVASVLLDRSKWKMYRIFFPGRITERTLCRFVVNRYYCPKEEGTGEDARKLGLAINKIIFAG